MAKLPTLWLQGASQRMAGAVVYQQAGRTLGRALAQQVANPRTSQQMGQRIKLANLVKLYQVNRSWAKLSFETKPRTWSDYNAFVSANLTGAAVYLTKQQVAAGAAVVAPVKVTSGTLGSVVLQANEDVIDTNINTGALEILATMTVAEFSAAILDNNNGIFEGDQFSLIQYIQQTDPQGFPFIICRPYEVILKRTDGRLLSDFIPFGLLAGGSAQDPILSVDASTFTGGVAVVLSRTTASGTRVSTSYICLTPSNTYYSQYTSAAAYNAAIISYGESTTVFLDSNSAADTSGNVALTNSLLSVTIANDRYVSGGNKTTPVPANNTFVFTFSQPVQSAAADIKMVAGPAGGTLNEVTTTNPTVSGNTVTFTPEVAVGPSGLAEGASWMLGVKSGDITYAVTLKNQSGNSMD